MTAFAKNLYGKKYRAKSAAQAKFLAKRQVQKNLYDWADGLFFERQLKAAVLHTLKAIIATRFMIQPTITQINEARTRSCSRKFAQANIVDDRTVRRHIQSLEKLGFIDVTRSRDKKRNSRNAYAIRAPEELLSCSSEDKVSCSLSCSSSSLKGGGGAIQHKHRSKTSNQFHHKHAADLPPFDGAASAVPNEQIKKSEQTHGKEQLRLLKEGLKLVKTKGRL